VVGRSQLQRIEPPFNVQRCGVMGREAPEGGKEKTREGWWNKSTKGWPKLEQLESLVVEKATVVKRREQGMRGRGSDAG
jgi:hypothetical protein